MSLTETGQQFRPQVPPVAVPQAPRQNGLITVGGVRALTGCGYDEIFTRVDGSDLILKPLVWVFDFASTWPENEKRDLRFWRAEVEALPDAGLENGGRHAVTGHWEIEWVVARILPPARTTYPAGDVVKLFCLNRSTLKKLRPQMAGQLATGGSTYTRAGLAAFLTARWLGYVSKRCLRTATEKKD